MKYETKYKGVMTPVKFRHDRIKDDKGTIMEKGGKTTAYIKVDDENFIATEAECSEKDSYQKELGRRITFGRLAKAIRDNDDEEGMDLSEGEGTPY